MHHNNYTLPVKYPIILPFKTHFPPIPTFDVCVIPRMLGVSDPGTFRYFTPSPALSPTCAPPEGHCIKPSAYKNIAYDLILLVAKIHWNVFVWERNHIQKYVILIEIIIILQNITYIQKKFLKHTLHVQDNLYKNLVAYSLSWNGNEINRYLAHPVCIRCCRRGRRRKE